MTKEDINSVYFSEEEVKNGLHNELINFLIKKSYTDQGDISYYEDIRVKPDDLGAITVSWGSCDWNHEFSDNHWAWLDDEHVVVKEVIFPDNHIELLRDCEEEDAMNEWLELHPEYEQNEYGRWVEKVSEDD